MKLKILFIGLLCFAASSTVYGQDTVRVSLKEFMNRGFKNISKVDAKRQEVRLANNKLDKVKGERILPKFTLNTQHGIIPGVKSDREFLSPHAYYLDPNLSNDFTDYSIFTRVHIKAIQPIFTWGALRDAVNAAEAAVQATKSKFTITKNKIKLRLYKLYQSYLLSLELMRLVNSAQNTINVVNKKIQEKKEAGKLNSTDFEPFKFKIFKSTFDIRAAKVKMSARYIQRVWNYILGGDTNNVYMPEDHFLDPVRNPIKTVAYYRTHAVHYRPEIAALTAGIKAAHFGLKATKESHYPKLFAGITGSLAYTPNRPRQSNPFIINKSNYLTAAIGIGIHQSLNFAEMHNSVQRSKIKLKQAKLSKSAVIEGIVLQVFKKYKNVSVSKTKIDKTYEALTKARRWVRLEKQKIDFKRGDPKDLVDALKLKLKLKAQYKQAIFQFNVNMAELYKTAALPLSTLKTRY